MKGNGKKSPPSEWAKRVTRAMRQAAKNARDEARRHGLPIYVWENGKVVAKKP